MKNNPYAISLIVLFAFLCIFRYFSLDDPYFVESDDSACYILLGKSIAAGQGYSMVWTQKVEPYVKAPPGFPILLASVIKVFGYNLSVLAMIPIILGLGILVIMVCFFDEISDRSIVAYVLMLTCLSAYFFSYIHLILSEILYMFFSLTALLYIQKAGKREFFYNRYMIIGALFIFVAYFTRIMGITLVLALAALVFFDVRPDKRRAKYFVYTLLLFLLLVIPILLWELRNLNIVEKTGITYLQEIFRYSQHIKEIYGEGYIKQIFKSLYSIIFYGIPGVLAGIRFSSRSFFALLLSAVVFIGFSRSIIKKRTFLGYYTFFYIAGYIFYPITIYAADRYMVPIMPIIFYFFIVGLHVIISAFQRYFNIKKSLGNYAIAFVVLVLMAVNAREMFAVNGGRTYLYGYEYRDVRDFLSMAEWVKENIPPDSIFNGQLQALHYLYFERKTASLPFLRSEHSFFRDYIDESTYIAITPAFCDNYFWESMITEFPDRVTEIYRKNRSAIYKVNGPR